MSSPDDVSSLEQIAIIGMSCRFPGGANTPESLWSMLSEGRSAWSDVPADRWNWKSFFHPSALNGTLNSRGGHFIDQDIRAFDAAFFGIPSIEAHAMDPQYRLQLETAYEALENAGITLEEICGSLTSVHIAIFARDYDRMMFKDIEDLAKYHLLSSGDAIASNRISYTFDLKGPSITIDTGCSGSLVALHQACIGLRTRETNMALVGGTSLILHPDTMIAMSHLNMLNSEGKSFVFDDRGSGYGRGEGTATIVLKRLEDAIKSGDQIRAIIKATGCNQDGRTLGIALPSEHSQQLLAEKTYDCAGIDPLCVSYVEAHGTGTVAGDLAETKSIANVFNRKRSNPLLIGSVKANIGHLESASGLAGLIKAVLILEKRLIPPHINFKNWKQGLNMESSNLGVALTLQPLPCDENGKAIVSVNSFGYGGTNALTILETANPKPKDINPYKALFGSMLGNISHASKVSGSLEQFPTRVFTISAKSKKSLIQMAENFQKWTSNQISLTSENEDQRLADLAYTLSSRRSLFQWRHSFLASSFREVLSSSIQAITKPSISSQHTRVAFIFTGQGAQWIQMGKELFKESEFRRSLEISEKILRDLGASWNLVEELLKPESTSQINQSKFSQPATTALQIAIVDLLKSINVTADAVVGHSSGEIAGAYAAGILTQKTSLGVSYHRSFLSDAYKSIRKIPGAMLAVGVGEREVLPYIDGDLKEKISVACVNSHMSTTISGDKEAIRELKSILDQNSIFARELKVDTAYHSYHMKLVANQYLEKLQELGYQEATPLVNFISSVTGDLRKSCFGPTYWVENLVSKVRFADGLETLCRIEKSSSSPGTSAAVALIEIGPHSTLSGPVRHTLTHLELQNDFHYLPSLIRNGNAINNILETARRLFDLGYPVNIEAANTIGGSPHSYQIVTDLPPYSWDHSKTFWHESRMSREHRLRAQPYHDLLGTPVINGAPSRLTWRNLISLDTLPWLSDHVVDGSTVFPGSGYICMAIEAIRQHAAHDQGIEDFSISSYALRNIIFSKALTIPEPPKHVEIQITLNPPRIASGKIFRDWREFEINSFQDGNWKQHCSGAIKINEISNVDEVEGQREDELDTNSKRTSFENQRQKASETMSHHDFYHELRSSGNFYGPNFTTVKNFRIGELHAIGTVLIPNIKACMPSNFLHTHVIHPATLDSVFQTGLPLYHKHCLPGPVMPVFIEELTINSHILKDSGKELLVATEADPTGKRSAYISALAFQSTEDSSLTPVITLSNIELKGVGDANQINSNKTSRNITYRMEWGIDAGFTTAARFQQLSPTTEPDMARIAKRQIMNQSATWFIKNFLDQLDSQPEFELKNHHALLITWMKKYVQSEKYTEFLSELSNQDVSEVLSKLPEIGVEGEFLSLLGSNLMPLISDEKDPLSMMLEGGLLQRFYLHDYALICSSHLVQYIKMLSFKNPNLKALEIGAGTGGTTMPLMTSSSSTFSKYDFTDISAGFFESARVRFQEWSNLLTFKVLDIERDPATQGFQEGSYDIVIASNVLHATKYMEQTLKNVGKLLKPGGKLLLVEITQQTPFDNITFGLLPGWWEGISDGRLDSPLMSSEKWDKVLKRTSFSGVEILASDFKGSPNWYDFMATTYVPQDTTSSFSIQILIPPSSRQISKSFSEMLGKHLEELKFPVSLSDWSTTEFKIEPIYVVIDSGTCPLLSNPTEEDFKRLTSLVNKTRRILWITCSEDGSLNAETALITGFSRVARTENPDLKFVTLDIQQSIPDPDQEIFQAISKIVSEFSNETINDTSNEFEYAYYDNQIHIPRLIPEDKFNHFSSPTTSDPKTLGIFCQEQRPLKLHVENPGLLDTLVFTDDTTKSEPLGDDEVEVAAEAFGINFKDVYVALGQMKGKDRMVGECSGTISKVGKGLKNRFEIGDHVCVLFAKQPFSNFTRAKGHLVFHIPKNMSFIAAASIPIVFITAYYGLVVLGNLTKGQTVLIHAASGGVGQAALVIAKNIGAEVFTTVSSATKKQLLVDEFGIPPSHIFSSRKKSFRQGIERLTQGKGVDVVLNSLSGEMLQETWHCIAPMGTFVEIGKADIYRRTELTMEPFDKNVTFASVDLPVVAEHKPHLIQVMFESIADKFSNGEYKPVHPIQKMPISDLQQAFRLIQARKHTGKIVLDARNSEPVLVTRPPRVPLALDSHGTYIIVGGLGGLGPDIAKFMAMHGAKNLAILSRRGPKADKAVTLSQELESLGATVKFISCDVSKDSIVQEAVADIVKCMPPIRGVIQAAMVLQDRILEKMDATDLKVALDPKVTGTKNLLTALQAVELDFFILLSSCSTILGNSTQANYSAACSFQDTLAQFQNRINSTKTNFVSLNLGLIEDSEFIRGISERALNLMREGSYIPVKLPEVLSLLEYCIQENTSGKPKPGIAQLAIGFDRDSLNKNTIAPRGAMFNHLPDTTHSSQANTATRGTIVKNIEEQISAAEDATHALKIVAEAIATKFAALIGSDDSDEGLDLNAPITNLGLDSLIAIELRNWISRTFQYQLSTTEIFDAVNLGALGKRVFEKSGLCAKFGDGGAST